MTHTKPYRIFDANLARVEDLAPHMRRFTFTGEEIGEMATLAPDQRIKIFFPQDDGTPPALPKSGDWYSVYKSVPVAERVAMRTYTIRNLRAEQKEVDIDFVLHGVNGPASRWAMGAQVGDFVQISAPNALCTEEIGGFEWKPPASARHILLAADETALPALAGILEALATRPDCPRVEAFVEVPAEGDRLALPNWPGLNLQWLARSAPEDEVRPGTLMAARVRKASLPAATSGGEVELEDVDIDTVVPWDRAQPVDGEFYAWIAGESEAVMDIRQFLIRDRGIDRRNLNLMGYWRYGKVYN